MFDLLPRFGSLQVGAITRVDVARFHGELGERVPYQANRCRELLSKMFELAQVWDYLPERSPNPDRKIQGFKEEKRQHWHYSGDCHGKATILTYRPEPRTGRPLSSRPTDENAKPCQPCQALLEPIRGLAYCHATHYTNGMIRDFQHKGLKRFFTASDAKLLHPAHVKRIRRLLDTLDSAQCVEDLNYASNNLHELKGDRKGTWSVWVSGNWRITFKFEDGNAYDVNLEDYH
jgi:toxin HigB-1